MGWLSLLYVALMICLERFTVFLFSISEEIRLEIL
jgi:hypothetical protein